MGRLIPGYDCPYHATYWNSTVHGAESSNTNINTICIFETDIGHPITRHSAGEYKQATKGSALVVRVVATVGNVSFLVPSPSLLTVTLSFELIQHHETFYL